MSELMLPEGKNPWDVDWSTNLDNDELVLPDGQNPWDVDFSSNDKGSPVEEQDFPQMEPAPRESSWSDWVTAARHAVPAMIGMGINGPTSIVQKGAGATDKEFADSLTSRNIISDVAGGVTNAPVNLGELAVAGAETALGGDGSWTEGYNEALPRYKADPNSITSKIAVGMGEAGAGGAVGGLGAATALRNAPSIVKGLGTLAGASMGEAATADSDSGGLVFGRDALVDLANAGDTETASEHVLASRLNILADAFAMGTALSAGGKAIATGFEKIVKNPALIAARFASKEIRDTEIAGQLATQMAGIKEGMDTREALKITEKMVDILSDPKNKNFVDKFMDGLPEDQVDELINSGIDLSIKRDTVSAIAEGAPELGTGAARLRAEAVKRQGVDTTDLEKALDAPSRKLEEVSEQLVPTTENIDAAANTLRSSVDDTERALELTHKQAVDDATMTSNQIDELFSGDDALGQKIKDLSQDVKFDLTKKSDDVISEIRTNVAGAKKAHDAELERLKERIPSEVVIDTNKIKEILEGDADLVEKFLPKSFVEALNNGEAKFKDLYKNIPMLSRKIDQTMNDPSLSRIGEDLRAIRDILNEPLEGSDQTAKEMIEDFRNYYKDTWAKYWRDGDLEDFADSYKRTQGKGIRAVDYASDTSDVLTSSMKDRASSKHVTDLLSTEEGGKSSRLVSDYGIAKGLERAQSILNRKGSFDAEDLRSVVTNLEKYKGFSPEIQAKMEAFATKVRDKALSLDEKVKAANQIRKDVDKQVKYLRENGYKDFYSKNPDTGAIVPNPDSEASFKNLLSGKDNDVQIKGVVDRIKKSGDKKAMKGVTDSWAKTFTDRMFKNERSTTGAKKINTEFLSSDEGKRLAKIGDTIMEDNPLTYKIVKELSKEADKRAAMRNASELSLGDSKNLSNQVMTAMNMAVTFLYGPLSRTGSKVRSGGSKLIKSLDPSGDINATVQKMLTEPEHFEKFARKWLAKESKVIDAKEQASFIGDLINLAVQSGVRSRRDAEADAAKLRRFTDRKLSDEMNQLMDDGDGAEALEITVTPKKR